MIYKPTGFRVLVKPDVLEEVDDRYKSAKAVGLLIAGQSVEREQEAVSTATILDIGPSAWRGFDDGTPWAKVGDRVVIAKFAGKVVKTVEGTELRIINDEDVLSVIIKDN